MLTDKSLNSQLDILSNVNSEAVPRRVVASDKTKDSLGLVHVYTGDGKGKTTASLGLALRAIGTGLQVAFVEFMKPASNQGELRMFSSIDNFHYFPIVIKDKKACDF